MQVTNDNIVMEGQYAVVKRNINTGQPCRVLTACRTLEEARSMAVDSVQGYCVVRYYVMKKVNGDMVHVPAEEAA